VSDGGGRALFLLSKISPPEVGNPLVLLLAAPRPMYVFTRQTLPGFPSPFMLFVFPEGSRDPFCAPGSSLPPVFGYHDAATS